MTIQIEDLNSLDFSDVADTHLGKLPPIHPGEILREEFLIPMGMTANALALALRVPAPRINDIVRGRGQLPRIRLCVCRVTSVCLPNFG